MSVEALAIALHHSRARTPTAKLVLIGVANHDGDGGAWPSVATLAKYAGCSVRQVQRCIDELERLGELRRWLQGGGTRELPDWRRPNRYVMLLRCPPSCDRTPQHRVKGELGPQLDLVEDPFDPVTPTSPQLSTGVTPTSPHPVTPMSPKPSSRTSHEDSTADQPPTARARVVGTWSHACLGGTHSEHQVSRKTGACAFCGATKITYEVEG